MVMRIELYSFKNIGYSINVVNNTKFNAIIDGFKTKYSWLRRRLIRGIALNGEIYIRESAKIGRNRLIEHEIGHILGKTHTWLPTTMNFTWVFRWIRYI